MRRLFNFVILIIFIFVWIFQIKYDSNVENKSKAYESLADEYNKQEVYEEALINYEKAYKLNNNIDIQKKIIEIKIKKSKYDNVFDELNKYNFDTRFKNYIYDKIIKIFLDNKDYISFNKYIEYVTDDIKQKYINLNKSKFIELGEDFEDINYFPYDEKIFAVRLKNNSLWSIINEKGKRIISSKYSQVLGLEYPYITTIIGKNTKVFTDKEELKSNLLENKYYQYSNGFMVRQDGTKYYYVNRVGQIKSEIYNYASNFNNGVAVACKSNCFLINNDFKILKEFNYKLVKFDERNNAIMDNKIIFQDIRGEFIYDINRNISSEVYKEIKFSNGDLIAVKKEKWGYISQDFKEVIDFIFEDAESFSCNLGVVNKDKKYHIIDENNKSIYITKAKIFPFNKRGIGFIKKENKMKMIKLVRYIND